MTSSVLYPQTNPASPEQLCITKGKGIYVYDNTGKEYIEGLSGLWSTSLGYGNEELIEVAQQQMRDLAFSSLFGGKTHPKVMELADTLAAMVPVKSSDGKPPKVFFGNSGSDANDTHLKILRYYFDVTGKPGKNKVIARHRGYHGVTLASSCLTGLPAIHSHFNLPFEALGILHTNSPHFYRDALPEETEREFCARIMDNLEQQILAEGPETIAAFIAEPVNGAGGVVIPPADYFSKLQSLLSKYDIFLIADEVISGFGRTGEAFGCDTFDIKPDMMSLAKALSSSYIPISAAVISDEIYQALLEPSKQVGVFGHGYTYSGHPVACAVASKVIEIYQRDNIFLQAKQKGTYLQNKLRQFMQFDCIGEVRGIGMIAGLEIVKDKLSKSPDAATANKIAKACQENGLIVRQVYGNTIALCPPLIITWEQIDELLERLAISIKASV